MYMYIHMHIQIYINIHACVNIFIYVHENLPRVPTCLNLLQLEVHNFQAQQNTRITGILVFNCENYESDPSQTKIWVKKKNMQA